MKYELKEEDILELGSYRGRNIRMVLPDKEDYISKCIIDSSSLYQESLLNSMLKTIPVNPNVIDIGAYTGSSAIWFSTIAGARHVMAIEPDEYIYSILETNVKLSGLKDTVSTVHAAIGANSGTARLKAVSSTNLGAAQYRACEPGAPDEIAMISIDSLAADCKDRVDVLHISMEGNEYLAIQGAKNIISRDKPVVIITLWSPETICIDPEYDCLSGYTKLTEQLLKFGYVSKGRYVDKEIFMPGGNA